MCYHEAKYNTINAGIACILIYGKRLSEGVRHLSDDDVHKPTRPYSTADYISEL
jgi:hypothetical protein